ncbi:hypothetical protein B566_EDAN002546 [Ephemera danica]|nr:hypothetical protein B566_EDAN002546 [Ephemera danica]
MRRVNARECLEASVYSSDARPSSRQITLKIAFSGAELSGGVTALNILLMSRFTGLFVATLRFTPAMLLPSKFAPFKFTLSMLALCPAGSSKLQPLKLAPSKFAHNILTPNKCAPSN